MRSSLALLAALLILAPAVRAIPADDPVLAKTLQICESNGIEAAMLNLYADRPAVAAEMKEKVSALAKGLGNVIDTEVIATHPVGKRVIRYYVAVYFARRPLWLRVDRYLGTDKSFFLPLKFSIEPDDILPAYVTDFPP